MAWHNWRLENVAGARHRRNTGSGEAVGNASDDTGRVAPRQSGVDDGIK